MNATVNTTKRPRRNGDQRVAGPVLFVIQLPEGLLIVPQAGTQPGLKRGGAYAAVKQGEILAIRFDGGMVVLAGKVDGVVALGWSIEVVALVHNADPDELS